MKLFLKWIAFSLLPSVVAIAFILDYKANASNRETAELVRLAVKNLHQVVTYTVEDPTPRMNTTLFKREVEGPDGRKSTIRSGTQTISGPVKVIDIPSEEMTIIDP